MTRQNTIGSTVSINDTFLTYTNNYKLLDSCDVTTGWTIYADTSTFAQNTTSFKNGVASLQVNFTQTAANRSVAYKTISATDVSAMGMVGFWVYVASNVKSSRFEIRIGQSGNYKEYRYTSGINTGWTYCEFDLSSPYAIFGSPDFSAVTYIWVGYYYNASETNTSWLVDSVYAYTSPNFTGGIWTYPNDSTLYGVATPSSVGVNVTNNSRYNSGNHGRMLYGTDNTPTNFILKLNVNKIVDDETNKNGWCRVLWDFVDGHNYSGVYLAGGYNKVGIEQYIDNTRDSSEVPFTFVTGRNYYLEVQVSGQDVKLFIDGRMAVSYTLTQPRLSGPFCLEAYGGNVDLYPTNTTTVEFSNFKVYSDAARQIATTRSAATNRLEATGRVSV